MIRTALFAALFATAGAAFAAPVSYNVDPTHTYASYEVNHLGLSTQTGTFTKVAGKLTVDEAAKSGSVDITIDAASLQTFLGDRDKHLKSADFFNVEKFPTLTYKSTAVEFKNGKPAEVKGNLTLLGVTKPVTLKMESFHLMPHPMLKKDALGANAVTKVKRSEFNMGKYTPYVGDDVTIEIAVEAIKQQ